jgi:Xaa-Pro aminopeptidase
MTLGMMATDAELRIDFEKMRNYKLKRIQDQLAAQNLGAVLLFDPDNVRYATSTTLGEWSRDKMVRFCIVPREGKPFLFDMGTAVLVKQSLCPWIPPENIRPGGGWMRGAHTKEVVAAQLQGAIGSIKTALSEAKVADMPIGIDQFDFYLLEGAKAAGINLVNGWDVMWGARLIKCKEELALIEQAAALADGCYEYIVDKIRPGVKESELVGEIYGWMLKHGADRMTGVNCVSGPRSNPPPHDWSDRMIRPGELVFIDIMGSFMGYGSCYYRTFATTRATQLQKDLHQKAYDWLQRSIDVVRPGITTADVANQWPTAQEMGYPNEFAALGLCCGHGIGVSIHEKPFLSRALTATPFTIEAGMHFALETFAGEGTDGARIEQQVIVTETGHKVITQWPCDELMVCAAR